VSLWDDFKKGFGFGPNEARAVGGGGVQPQQQGAPNIGLETGITTPIGNFIAPGVGSAATIIAGQQSAASPENAPFPARPQDLTREQLSANASLLGAGAAEVASVPFEYVGNKAARVINTGLIGLDYAFGGDEALNQAGINSVEDAWNATQYVSVGQEIVGGFNKFLGDQQNNGAAPREQVLNAIAKRERLNEFKDNWWANKVSGASDAALFWYANDFVLIGKAAKVTKLALTTQTTRAEAAQIRAGKGGGAARIDDYTKETNAQVINESLKRTPTDSGNLKLASLLAESKDYKTTANIWLASRGDVKAIAELRAEKASVFDALQREQSTIDALVLTGPADGIPPHIKDVIDDLVRTDNFLARTLTGEVIGSNRLVKKTLAQNSTLGVSRFANVENIKLAQSAERANARWGFNNAYIPITIARNPAVRSVTVWIPRARQSTSMAAFRPRETGLFHLSGANFNDTAVEMEAILMSKPIRTNFTPEQRAEYFNRVGAAPNAEEVNKVLQEFESDAIYRIGQSYGIDDKTISEIETLVLRKRNETVNQVNKDKGFFIENGEIHKAKVNDAQTPNTFTMLPLKEVDRTMMMYARSGAGRGIPAEGLEAMNTKTIGDKLASLDDAFQSVWKPLVLFRLGYPVRNVSEGAFRFAAVTNMLAAGSALGKGAVTVGERTVFRTRTLFKGDKMAMDYADDLDNSFARLVQLRALNPAALDRNYIREIKFLEGRTAALEAILKENLTGKGLKSLPVASLGVSIKPGTLKPNYVLKPNEYKGVSWENTYAGASGSYLADQASAAKTQQATISGGTKTNQGLGKGERLTKEDYIIQPSDPGYSTALLNTINQDMRNSAVVRRIMAGESEEDVVLWLARSDTQEAQFARNRLNIKGNDEVMAEYHTIKAANMVNLYIRDPELALKASARNLTHKDVDESIAKSLSDRGLNKDQMDLHFKPIHGQEIVDTVAPTSDKWYARARDKMFHVIGTLPEDIFLRHPFVDMKTKEYMRQAIKDYEAQGVTSFSNDEIAGMMLNARTYALKEVKRTLYTIDRYSNAAATMRFVSPFFAAWDNTARTWGRIVLSDPSVAAKGYLLLDAPAKGGLLVDSQDGTPLPRGLSPIDLLKRGALQLPMPGFIKDRIPFLDGLRVPLSSLNVVLQGQNPLIPGSSPLVSWGLNVLGREYADTPVSDIANFLVTPSDKSVWQSFLPAGYKSMLDAYLLDTAPNYVSDASRFYTQKVKQLQAEGKPIPSDIWQQTRDEVRKFYFLKGLGNLALPASPQYTIKPEYQLLIDQWKQEESRGITKDTNGNDVTPFERYTQNHPSDWQFAFGLTDNRTGVRSNKSSVANAKRYSTATQAILNVGGGEPAAIDSIAPIVGAVINDPNDTSYDSFSSNWLSNRSVSTSGYLKYKEKTSAQEAVNQPYISVGWEIYGQASDFIQASLVSRGIKSVNSRGAEDLLKYKNDTLNLLKNENPAWWANYSGNLNPDLYNLRGQAFEAVFNDPTFSSDKKLGTDNPDPTWNAIMVYVELRKDYNTALSQRQFKSIEHPSNTDLKDQYIDLENDVRGASPEANKIFTRFFENEFIRPEALPSTVGSN